MISLTKDPYNTSAPYIYYIAVKEKPKKAIKPETITFHWRKPCSDVMHEFTGFTTEPIKEIMKETVNIAQKHGGKDSTFGS